jgi:hypothetical protein
VLALALAGSSLEQAIYEVLGMQAQQQDLAEAMPETIVDYIPTAAGGQVRSVPTSLLSALFL